MNSLCILLALLLQLDRRQRFSVISSLWRAWWRVRKLIKTGTLFSIWFNEKLNHPWGFTIMPYLFICKKICICLRSSAFYFLVVHTVSQVC